MTMPPDVFSWPEHGSSELAPELEACTDDAGSRRTVACRLIILGLKRLILADLLTPDQATVVVDALAAELHTAGGHHGADQ